MRSKRGRHTGRSGRKARNPNPSTSKKQLAPVLRFVLVFLLALLVGGYAYSFVSSTYRGVFEWLTRLTATLAGGLGSLFSANVSQSGCTVTYNGFAVEIIDECSGVFEMVIYTVAVVAYPASFRKKVIGIVAGIPAIFVFNVLRIAILMIAGAQSYRLFAFLHLYLWQVTLVLLIAGVWVAWLYWVVYRGEKRSLAVPG